MSEAQLEVLVIGNPMERDRPSLPQQLVGITFYNLRGSLKKPVNITNTSKERASDFLPSSNYAAVIVDPGHRGSHDDEWLKQARQSGLLNGQKIFLLSRNETNEREMRYEAREESMKKLAYKIAGKK